MQLVNRVGWDGAIRPPDPNELGWKDTVRMNPLEDCIVAMRPTTPTLPFKVPDSVRALDPSRPLGTSSQFTGVDPSTGQPITVVNEPYNFGWEYVWHCHILGHEENDMMRPVVYLAAPAGPSGLTGTELTATSVHLSWTDNATNPVATEMTIQRATNSAFTQNLRTFTTSGTATSYVDAAVASGQTYYYRVRAENDVSYSAWSNMATVSIAVVPPAPTNLAARTSLVGLAAKVDLTWAEGTTANLTGFTVQQATNSSFTTGVVSVQLPATARSHSFTALGRASRYYFRVQALNGSVASAWATVSIVTP